MREYSQHRRSVVAHSEAVALRRLVDLLSHRSGAALSVMEKAGVTLAQILLLDRVGKLERTSITALAEDSPTSAAAVSQMVDRLVRQGFLRRTEDATDRRRKAVSISSKGTTLLRELERARTAEFARGLSAISPKLRAELGALLEQAAAEVEKSLDREGRRYVGAAQ